MLDLNALDGTAQEREPQLKYGELGEDVPGLLEQDQAASFYASDKLHVLGCDSGAAYVLDFEGHCVRPHKLVHVACVPLV